MFRESGDASPQVTTFQPISPDALYVSYQKVSYSNLRSSDELKNNMCCIKLFVEMDLRNFLQKK